MAIPPTAPSTATPAIRAVWREVAERFGTSVGSAGVFCCKRIGNDCGDVSGSASFSQHAFGNGWDITGTTIVLNRVAVFLRSSAMRQYVSQVLWQIPGHYGHIHVSGRPYLTGIPECAGGAGGLGVTTPSEVRVVIPSMGELLADESWAPAARTAARELVRRANRIARVPEILGRILGRG